MKNLKYGALALFVVGIGVLGVALAMSSGGEDDKAAPVLITTPAASASASASSPATAGATSTPTALPTPTPFNGKVMRLKIPRFGVDAPIEDLAINSRGELDTPKVENKNVGWYYIYDKPGRLNPDNAGWAEFGGKQKGQLHFRGNTVFSAHVYYRNVPAPFVSLAKAQPGDEVVIAMEDGREYRYKVISNKRYHRDTIPMANIIWPADKPDNVEWITMITCGGELDSTGQEYVSRDVIVAAIVE